jgi:hypothetical protein
MPWPDDYIDWSRRLYPLLYRAVVGPLVLRCNHPSFQADLPDLAKQARAFALARHHEQHPGYFLDFPEFRSWIGEVAFAEAVRLYLRHPALQPRINGLGPTDARLLQFVYVDRLSRQTFAGLLGIPPDQVEARAAQVFQRV